MPLDRLRGVQYVRLAPGAAESIAPYLQVSPDEVLELVIDLFHWPDDLVTPPIRGRDGRLLAGDPILLAATDAGLIFAGRGDIPPIVPWHVVRSLEVLRATTTTPWMQGDSHAAVPCDVTVHTRVPDISIARDGMR